MNQSHHQQYKLLSLLPLSVILTICFSKNSILPAQITPDNTLGSESSVIIKGTENELPAHIVEGGAERGVNLFHSFSEFNVDPGQQVYFNDRGFSHIFSRITGNNYSNILGTLGVRGNADLFLLNPNGIIFGENASLDVNGSFVATTANSIVFDNNLTFSASNPEVPPMLTVNIPLGLQYGSKPGKILNRSQSGSNIFGLPAGLEVKPNQDLALVGGNLELEAGNLTAQEGRIELGSVGNDSFVRLTSTNPGWQLAYEEVPEFGDIIFSQGAIVLNISNEQAGEIQIQGKNIEIKEGSQIVSANIGTEAGGKIDVSATKQVSLNGRSDNGDPSTILSITAANGRAGGIEVSTPQLTIENGAEILSSDGFASTELSSDEAGTGNITINASELITVKGVSSNQQSSQLATQSFVGNGGNIYINTERLEILEGGQISASTFGEGQGGTITVNASETLKIVGIGGIIDNEAIRSALISRSEPDATGDAGDLIINTNNLFVKDGGEMNVSTFGEGGAGNIFLQKAQLVSISDVAHEGLSNSRLIAITEGASTGGSIKIDTKKLLLENGGQILTSTFGDGEGGNIEIINAELIEIVGSSGDFLSTINSGGIEENSTGKAGTITITTNELKLRENGEIGAGTFSQGQAGTLTISASDIELDSLGSIRSGTIGLGNAGNLNITTETLTIKGGADISANSRENASGNSGDINISASNILITDGGKIEVFAEGTGQAGSLNINAQDITLNNGRVTAETRTGDRGNITIDKANTLLLRNNSEITTNATEQATGGDITITSALIVLQNNSNITANAIEGRGGNILITTQGLFHDLDSEITAASELGIDGTIAINTPDVDPASGLVELPDVPVDVSALLARNICDIGRGKAGNNSSFINTGRGGLPTSPYEPLESNDIFVDVQLPTEWRKKSTTNSSISEPATKHIVEASAWVINEKGNVELVSQLAPKTVRCGSKDVDAD
ncbi:MAG: filamentous hemagglutinin N-terminal domain-containing protein [Xenococcus sp. (in: cyanobacteria)]